MNVWVDSEVVRAHQFKPVGVVFARDPLVDGDGMAGDIGVVYPVYVGVGAVHEGLGGADDLRGVVLVPQLRFGSLLLVFLLNGRLVVWRRPVRG